MKHPKFVRSLTMALALILLCAALPLGTLAAEDKKRPVEIKAEHVRLDQTRFEHTGEEIRPNVTVRVGDHLLTLDREYSLEFKDNVEVGTATVIVKGLPNAKPQGYSGKVEIPFYIDPKEPEETQPELTAITAGDVTLDSTEFTATGEAIEPAVTVTVAGKVLTAGEDYTLRYENNVTPGTASVTVTGVADKGYTGSVTLQFTIQESETPDETQPDETQPDETQPDETQPGETEPEETEPEETKPVAYKITRGNGAIWRKDSGKTLSFASDGHARDFESLEINGKTVNSKYYTLEKGRDTVITLKKDFLQRLDLGRYTITLKFADGEAEGRFKVGAAADESNPKTGDNFALHSWTALLFVSLTGIIGAAFAYRKKLFK